MKSTPDRTRLKNLHQLSRMKSDLALAALTAARLECEKTTDQLAGLNCPPGIRFEGDDAAAMEQQRLLYRSWAERRRIALNGLLARQKAEAAERLTEAREAFGKADVIGKLCPGSVRKPRPDPG
ncbi:hypothetical protein [Falsigemmobacter faecalis]|uniref:Uncharacterized protein n=1 Tax=Falsigemmobacter faecalis TaxID=2488730 RepID=A0A3P3DJ51_9RHOB|nr:hypothetical protein [Falsigemmobacter faecalis]RRH74290.1 hypothetical protein EG244_11090 [Falsigemmobacter faecalis]